MWFGECAYWTAKLPQAAPALEGCSPVQVDSSQGSGKYMGTQKGNVVRESLHGLLYSLLYFILFFPNSHPSLAASSRGEQCHTTSHKHCLSTQRHGQVPLPDPVHTSHHISQGGKVEWDRITLPST